MGGGDTTQVHSDNSHALVVGGTGMLRGVSLHLTKHYTTVSVVARSNERLKLLALAASGPGMIHPLPVDYHEDESLRAALRDVIALHGPVRLAVLWIHSTAPRAPGIIAQTVQSAARPCRFVQIIGSGSDAASDVHQSWHCDLESINGLIYQRVILGHVIESGCQRWLTDDEIATGVIRAIDRRETSIAVGQVDR